NYYNSYYHRIDSYSGASDYQTKTLSDKLVSDTIDPYNPEKDEALPEDFPSNLQLDLAKEAKNAIESISGLTISDFELTAANLKLTLIRGEMQSALSQSIYIGNFDPKNEALQKVLLDKVEKLSAKGILAPKGFKDAGVKIGDKGVLSFYAPSASSIQEQRLPIVVQGFYDPGIIPVGGKLILANRDIIKVIRAGQHQEEAEGTEGFHVKFDDLSKVDVYKQQIESLLSAKGLLPYFKVESFKEFDFTKDLIQQLHSEKNIFSLIATVIIIVACSNIISMLIILVNDKKTEIGILRSMGASSLSISSIFGLCGVIMGLIGSLIGITAAVL
ncbi:MAG: ABC transporter permease, partial [Parachlamydiaceae bacterium]